MKDWRCCHVIRYRHTNSHTAFVVIDRSSNKRRRLFTTEPRPFFSSPSTRDRRSAEATDARLQSALSAEQSRSEARRLRSVLDPTRACVQAPPNHGRGRTAPACRGEMGDSRPASDWQRDQWMVQTTDKPALQLTKDILNIHSKHYCICSHTDWNVLNFVNFAEFRVKPINFFLY